MEGFSCLVCLKGTGDFKSKSHQKKSLRNSLENPDSDNCLAFHVSFQTGIDMNIFLNDTRMSSTDMSACFNSGCNMPFSPGLKANFVPV